VTIEKAARASMRDRNINRPRANLIEQKRSCSERPRLNSTRSVRSYVKKARSNSSPRVLTNLLSQLHMPFCHLLHGRRQLSPSPPWPESRRVRFGVLLAPTGLPLGPRNTDTPLRPVGPLRTPDAPGRQSASTGTSRQFHPLGMITRCDCRQARMARLPGRRSRHWPVAAA